MVEELIIVLVVFCNGAVGSAVVVTIPVDATDAAVVMLVVNGIVTLTVAVWSATRVKLVVEELNTGAV